jgi:predicted XRE-type DNA-binding protein
MDNKKVTLADFHVGNLIISYLKRNNIPQAHLARELGMATPNFNRLLKRESMDTNLILEISEKLKHNFFADISGDTEEGKAYVLIHAQVGNSIESRLKELKMTQTQFAAIFEVTPAEVSRLIKKDSFDAQKLLKISRLLNYNFFQDFYQYSSHTENRSIDGWASIMKRNEELVAENARLRDYLKDVYSKMQKFKEDNGVSIENWDSLVKKEGVDVMNMASFFFLDANIKKFLDESDQTDSSKKTDKD